MEVLNKVPDQKETLNITSVGENMYYHGIHFLKGRGWSEEQLVDAIKNHYHLYDVDPEPEEIEDKSEEVKD